MTRALDRGFAFLCVVVVILNLPLITGEVFPQHDTRNFLENFFFFYSELFFHGELALWVPNGFYGLPSDFFFICQQPPMYYLVALVGAALRIRHVLGLFIAATILEQLVLLYGTWLLSSAIFRHRFTVLFVCAATVASQVLIVQTTFNFRMFYLLPLLIHFLRRYLQGHGARYALYTAFVFVLSLPGGAPYIAVITLLELAVFGLVFVIRMRPPWRRLLPASRREAALCALLAAAVGAYVIAYALYVRGVLDLTEVLSSGRDPTTGKVDLGTFLSYGDDIGFAKFRDLVDPVWRLAQFASNKNIYDQTLFTGLLPLLFLVRSVRSWRASNWQSLLAVCIVLGLFSAGSKTFLAESLYHLFPGMKHYRHIGFVVSCYKILVPLLAGFFLDHLLDGRSVPFREFIWVGLAGMGAVAVMGRGANIVFWAGGAVVMATWLVASRHRTDRMRLFQFTVMALLCLELGTYQRLLTKAFAASSAIRRPSADGYFDVTDHVYQENRSDPPTSSRAAVAYGGTQLQWSQQYGFTHNVMRWDPCSHLLHIDTVNRRLIALIRARGGSTGGAALDIPPDETLLKALGCLAPKLRMINDVRFAGNSQAAASLIAEPAFPADAVVLERDPAPIRDPGAWSVRVTEFRSNAVAADVSSEGGGWLYQADGWNPRWRASVDGVPVEVIPANIAFKAVPVPPGMHRVRFTLDSGGRNPLALVLIVCGVVPMLIFVGGALALLRRRVRDG